jgi:hypothetical protein
LIARNLGTLPVIRPRLPSLYEPYGDRGGAVAMPFEAEFSEVETIEAGASALPAEEIAEPSVATARQSRGSEPDSRPVSQAVEEFDQRRLVTPGPAMPLPGRQLSPVRVQAAPAVQQKILSQSSQAEERRLIPTEASLAVDAEANVELSRTPPQRDITEHPQRSAFIRSPGSPRQPVLKLPHNNNASPRPGTEEPSVHVTIGRVDVRSVVPETPVSRPAPARSRSYLSLDDYLKQRDRGER